MSRAAAYCRIDVRLVLCRVALMLCRHADVLSRSLCHGSHPAVTRDDAGPTHHDISAIQDDGYASETLGGAGGLQPPCAHTSLGKARNMLPKKGKRFPKRRGETTRKAAPRYRDRQGAASRAWRNASDGEDDHELDLRQRADDQELARWEPWAERRAPHRNDSAFGRRLLPCAATGRPRARAGYGSCRRSTCSPCGGTCRDRSSPPKLRIGRRYY